jgi:hypothetical protein
MEGRNILHIDGNKATIHLDVFKTRWRTNKQGKRIEVLPRYVKELDENLTSHLKDYIKKCAVTDMSKVKDGKEHYLFFLDTNEDSSIGYDDNGFSKLVSSYIKIVFNTTGVVPNLRLRRVLNEPMVKLGTYICVATAAAADICSTISLKISQHETYPVMSAAVLP